MPCIVKSIQYHHVIYQSTESTGLQKHWHMYMNMARHAPPLLTEKCTNYQEFSHFKNWRHLFEGTFPVTRPISFSFLEAHSVKHVLISIKITDQIYLFRKFFLKILNLLFITWSNSAWRLLSSAPIFLLRRISNRFCPRESLTTTTTTGFPASWGSE